MRGGRKISCDGLAKNILSGCGSVGKAVSSDPRGRRLRIQSLAYFIHFQPTVLKSQKERVRKLPSQKIIFVAGFQSVNDFAPVANLKKHLRS